MAPDKTGWAAMYRPRYYREDDPTEVLRMIEEHPFGVLITSTGGLWATHLPLIHEAGGQHGELVGHVARGNEQWRRVKDGDEVLAIFSGPDSYISPRWYSAEPDVPTWNYTAVHCYGRWKCVDNPNETRRVLEKTVSRFEVAAERPWRLADISQDLVARLQAGVVAFRISIERLEGVRKLGQDKTARDISGVVDGLRGQGNAGAAAVAELMERANQSEREEERGS